MIPPGRHGADVGERAAQALNGIYAPWTGCQWKALLKDSAAEEHGLYDYLEAPGTGSELPRVRRRPIDLSYAAMPGSSSMV